MKTLTKTSSIAKIKQFDLTQKQQVCELLQWSEQMYFDFMFQQYNDFLNRLFFGYPQQMLNEVAQSPVFRGFWNNEVSFRNESEFLPFAQFETQDYYEVNEAGKLIITPAVPLGDCFLVDEFMIIHNPKTLMSNDAFMHRFNKTLSLLK
ncbi:MAG: hypothetical protein EOO42_04355 [Flavobacteriales bacterium]|nr:MAG: hypothetical protein EOO42_04355 [Flavobacteriales bacterium]